MATSGWQLLVHQGPRAGQSFDLDRPVITIGREINNDIVIEDPQISRHHARFMQQGAGYVIEDLGSTNGTFINGQRVMGAMPINNGDMLGLGDNVVLQVMGAAGTGETMVATGQPQTLAASFSAPPPPPSSPGFGVPTIPPSAFGAPPSQPLSDFSAPPPPPVPKSRSRWWLWGCGCLVLLCIIVVVALGGYLYNRPDVINTFLDMLGIPLRFH